MNENEKVFGKGAIALWAGNPVAVLAEGRTVTNERRLYMVEILDTGATAIAGSHDLTSPPVVDGHVLGHAAGGGVVVGATQDGEVWHATIETRFKKGWVIGWRCEHDHFDVSEAIRCGVRQLDQPVTPEAAAYVEGVLAGREDR